MGIGSAIQAHNGIRRERVADGTNDTLRSQGDSLARGHPIEQRIPLRHACLTLAKKAIVLLAQQGQQRAERLLCIADQSDLHRIAQSDAVRFRIDLHAARGAGRRVGINPGHGGTDNQDRVASVHRLFGRDGPEMTDASG